jgi:NAD(P)H-hydrate epimerase
MSAHPSPRYIDASTAQAIDDHLMGEEGGFELAQLMELAGLACATALGKTFPLGDKYDKVLVCCGPGNQGGDGLVAARHLCESHPILRPSAVQRA